jgi:hypothetical protein
MNPKQIAAKKKRLERINTIETILGRNINQCLISKSWLERHALRVSQAEVDSQSITIETDRNKLTIMAGQPSKNVKAAMSAVMKKKE